MFIASAALVAACASGTDRAYYPVPTASPTALASSGTVTSSTTVTVPLPTLGVTGVTVAGTLPTANVAASITEGLSLGAPTGATAFAARRDTPASPSPIVYVEFSSSTSVTLSATPALAFTLTSITSGDAYYLAYYNGTTWAAAYDGPGTVNGNTVSFAAFAGAIPITAAQPAIFALYATPASTPTPVPTPVASPNAVALAPGGSPVTFSVSEAGNAAAFTSAISCSTNPTPSPVPTSDAFVAQVSPASATPSSAGGAVTFTATPGNETGSCTVTITDANNASITVPVTVSTTNVIIYGTSRKTGKE
jgi:hypothetical protein